MPLPHTCRLLIACMPTHPSPLLLQEPPSNRGGGRRNVACLPHSLLAILLPLCHWVCLCHALPLRLLLSPVLLSPSLVLSPPSYLYTFTRGCVIYGFYKPLRRQPLSPHTRRAPRGTIISPCRKPSTAYCNTPVVLLPAWTLSLLHPPRSRWRASLKEEGGGEEEAQSYLHLQWFYRALSNQNKGLYKPPATPPAWGRSWRRERWLVAEKPIWDGACLYTWFYTCHSGKQISHCHYIWIHLPLCLPIQKEAEGRSLAPSHSSLSHFLSRHAHLTFGDGQPAYAEQHSRGGDNYSTMLRLLYHVALYSLTT